MSTNEAEAKLRRVEKEMPEDLAALDDAIQSCEVPGGVITWDHPFGADRATYAFAARWVPEQGWYLTGPARGAGHVNSRQLALWLLSSTFRQDFPIYFATEWEQVWPN